MSFFFGGGGGTPYPNHDNVYLCIRKFFRVFSTQSTMPLAFLNLLQGDNGELQATQKDAQAENRKEIGLSSLEGSLVLE